MKIKIVSQTNPKLLQNFPKDPYSDITILSKNNKYCLLLAYLSIDSGFFGQLHTGMQIDLSHLPQQQLIKVLRALYGGQLQANSISQLESLYRVIKFLQIQQYQHSLAQQIVSREDLLNSIDIFAFCLDNNFRKNQILNYHLDNDLHVLTNSKNYLRLNKIPAQSLISILIQFYQRLGQKSDQTINHILENYLNRNKFTANDFFQNFFNFQFQNQTILPLIRIWEKHHHKLNIKDFVKYKSTGDLSLTMSINKQRISPPIDINLQNLISQKILQLVQQSSVENQRSSSATDSASAQSGSGTLSESLLIRIQELKKAYSNNGNSKAKIEQINNQNLLSIPSPKNRANQTLSEYLNQKRSCIIEKASQSENSDCDQPISKYGTGSQRIQRSNCLNVTFGGFKDSQKLQKSSHTKIQQQQSPQKSSPFKAITAQFEQKSINQNQQQNQSQNHKNQKLQDNVQTSAATSEQIYSDLRNFLLKYQTKKSCPTVNTINTINKAKK